MSNKATVNGKYLMYRGKPLLREKNAICYGDMDDEYVLFMLILSNKTVNGKEVPDRILIQILSTDMSLSPSEKLIKQGEKNGLFNAFDIGLIWLDRALNAA